MSILLITDLIHLNYKLNIQDTHLSDHPILHLTITNLSTSEQIINKSKTIIDYNQINMSSFNNINSSQNMESFITNIQNLVIPLTKNIPNKIKLFNKKPWMNSNLIETFKNRNYFFKLKKKHVGLLLMKFFLIGNQTQYI